MANSLATASNGGVATNPVAGTAIATVLAAVLPTGACRVKVTPILAGTIAAGDAMNMQLKAGATVLTVLAIPGAAGIFGPYTYLAMLDGTANLTVNAVANASGASAVYGCTLQVDALVTGVAAGVEETF